MSKFQTLSILVLLASPLAAETILWKAEGTLNSGSGVFLRDDLSPDDPVTIRITYDDQAIQQIRGSVLGQVESDYRTDIDLSITISTGNYTWEASVSSGTTTSPTTFRTVTKAFPGPESARLEVSSNDEGTFPSFPFRLNDSAASVLLNFNGANNRFLASGITATDIDPAELASATGSITTGVGNSLSFTITPASLEVLLEKDEAVAPIAVVPEIAVSADTVTLAWQSDARFRYLIESSPDLTASTWTPVETRFGTDAIITRNLPRAQQANFFRIQTLPRTEP